jgi:hypothetical protein
VHVPTKKQIIFSFATLTSSCDQWRVRRGVA